jgi:hypothetical protein
MCCGSCWRRNDSLDSLVPTQSVGTRPVAPCDHQRCHVPEIKVFHHFPGSRRRKDLQQARLFDNPLEPHDPHARDVPARVVHLAGFAVERRRQRRRVVRRRLEMAVERPESAEVVGMLPERAEHGLVQVAVPKHKRRRLCRVEPRPRPGDPVRRLDRRHHEHDRQQQRREAGAAAEPGEDCRQPRGDEQQRGRSGEHHDARRAERVLAHQPRQARHRQRQQQERQHAPLSAAPQDNGANHGHAGKEVADRLRGIAEHLGPPGKQATRHAPRPAPRGEVRLPAVQQRLVALRPHWSREQPKEGTAQGDPEQTVQA